MYRVYVKLHIREQELYYDDVSYVLSAGYLVVEIKNGVGKPMGYKHKVFGLDKVEYFRTERIGN